MHIAPMYPGKPSSHPSQKSCTLPCPQHEPHFISRLPPSLNVISFPPKFHPLQNLDIIQIQLYTRSRNLTTPIPPDLLPAAVTDLFNVDDEKDTIVLQGEEEDFESVDEDIFVMVWERRCAQKVDAELKHSISIHSSLSSKTQNLRTGISHKTPAKTIHIPTPQAKPASQLQLPLPFPQALPQPNPPAQHP